MRCGRWDHPKTGHRRRKATAPNRVLALAQGHGRRRQGGPGNAARAIVLEHSGDSKGVSAEESVEKVAKCRSLCRPGQRGPRSPLLPIAVRGWLRTNVAAAGHPEDFEGAVSGADRMGMSNEEVAGGGPPVAVPHGHVAALLALYGGICVCPQQGMHAQVEERAAQGAHSRAYPHALRCFSTCSTCALVKCSRSSAARRSASCTASFCSNAAAAS